MDATRETTLEAYFDSSSPTQLRPIMTSLNGDNSWLLSFPRPSSERATTGKAYYHIVFEPWLNGPTSFLSSWFVHLAHSHPPAITNADGVAAVARQIEAAATRSLPSITVKQPDNESHVQPPQRDIDAIFLGFHYLDHAHEPTLRLSDRDIPVIATPEAIAVIKPWNHFSTILSISSLDAGAKSWREPSLHPGDPFPSWLTPVRLPGHHELNYVTALVWTHDNDIHEAILQTPHGTKLDEGPLQAFLDAEPKTEKLALLHGLKESHAVGSMNTYGAEGGLALYRRIGGVKYWVPTHHSELSYSGIMMKLLWVHDTPRTVQWALDKEAEHGGTETERRGGIPNVVEVKNGDCFVLV